MTTEVINKPDNADGACAAGTRNGSHYRPNVDIVDRSDELTVYADVPGARGEDVEVEFEKGTLTVHARVAERPSEGTELLLNEYGVGDFHRSFQIGDQIDVEGITAQCADGVLTLHLPKVQAVRPRKIAVQLN